MDELDRDLRRFFEMSAEMDEEDYADIGRAFVGICLRFTREGRLQETIGVLTREMADALVAAGR